MSDTCSKVCTNSIFPFSTQQLDRFASDFYEARKEYLGRRSLSDSRNSAIRVELTPPENSIATTIEDSLPLELIGVGSGRVCFRHAEGDTVIRIARFGNYHCPTHPREYDGIYQNEHEVTLWKEVKETPLESYLLPILNHSDDFLWVTQPLITPLSQSVGVHDGFDIARELAREVGQTQLGEYIDSAEILPGNVARYQDSVVVFDYGLPPGSFE